MDTSELAVSYVEGIGRVSAQNLKSIGVYTVSDLVRASGQQISAATEGRVSDDIGRRWRAMALLLEIDGIDNQLAEALVDAGIGSTEQVRMRSAAELVEVFSQAHADDKIPEIPDLDKVHGITLDATHLNFTGTLTGTVLDSNNEPIVGASVFIANQTLTTDQRGRYRALRISLGFDHELSIAASGFEPYKLTDPPVIADDAVLSVEITTLTTAMANPPPVEPLIQCEFKGDQLPRMTHHTMTTRAMGGASTLREGDVLVLHRFYASGDEVQLSSKFQQYEDGRFMTLNWRIPVASLPADAALKEVFRYRRGNFSRLRMSANQLQHYLALQRARKSLHGSAPPVTPMEIELTVSLFSDAIREQI